MIKDNLDEQYQVIMDLVSESDNGNCYMALTDIMLDHFQKSVKVLKLEEKLKEFEAVQARDKQATYGHIEKLIMGDN